MSTLVGRDLQRTTKITSGGAVLRNRAGDYGLLVLGAKQHQFQAFVGNHPYQVDALCKASALVSSGMTELLDLQR